VNWEQFEPDALWLPQNARAVPTGRAGRALRASVDAATRRVQGYRIMNRVRIALTAIAAAAVGAVTGLLLSRIVGAVGSSPVTHCCTGP